MPDIPDFSKYAKPDAPSGKLSPVTSRFGAPRPYGGHTGADLGWGKGEGVGAPRPGRVTFAGTRGGYGNRVEVDHGDGNITTYSHLDGIDVQEGDEIDVGSRIGRVGNTGKGTGPHLHFEVLQGGKKIDPEKTGIAPIRGAREVLRRAAMDFSKYAGGDNTSAPMAGEMDFSKYAQPSSVARLPTFNAPSPTIPQQPKSLAAPLDTSATRRRVVGAQPESDDSALTDAIAALGGDAKGRERALKLWRESVANGRGLNAETISEAAGALNAEIAKQNTAIAAENKRRRQTAQSAAAAANAAYQRARAARIKAEKSTPQQPKDFGNFSVTHDPMVGFNSQGQSETRMQRAANAPGFQQLVAREQNALRERDEALQRARQLKVRQRDAEKLIPNISAPSILRSGIADVAPSELATQAAIYSANAPAREREAADAEMLAAEAENERLRKWAGAPSKEDKERTAAEAQARWKASDEARFIVDAQLAPQEGELRARLEPEVRAQLAREADALGLRTDFDEQAVKTRVDALIEMNREAQMNEAGVIRGVETNLASIKNNPAKVVPFLSAFAEGMGLVKLKGAADRLRDNKATQSDEVMLREFASRGMAKKSFGYEVVDVLAQLPAFAIEFAATGGLYTAGKKGTQKIILDRLGKQTLKEVEKGVAGRALGIGIRGAGNLAGTVARAPVVMPLRVAADTLRRTHPNVSVTEDQAGNLAATITKEGDGFTTALRKAIPGQFNELLSETMGGGLKYLPLAGKIQALKAGMLNRVLGTGGAEAAERFAKKLETFGYNGVAGELTEERFVEVLNGLMDVDDYKLLGVSPAELSTADGALKALRQLAVEGTAFMVPGVATTAAGKFTGGRTANEPQPLPESRATTEAQTESAADPASPRIAVFYPENAPAAPVAPGFVRVPVDGGELHVDRDSAKASGLVGTKAIQEFVKENGIEPLIGKVAPVVDTSTGAALRTEDADGRELSTSIVPNVEAAEAQAEVDRAQFPQVARQGVVDAQDAVVLRAEEVAQERAEQQTAPQADGTNPRKVLPDSDNLVASTAERAAEQPPTKAYAHRDFGEVVETADQAGVGAGKVRVAEVEAPEVTHVIQRPNGKGAGNFIAVPSRRGIVINPRTVPQATPQPAARLADTAKESVATPVPEKGGNREDTKAFGDTRNGFTDNAWNRPSEEIADFKLDAQNPRSITGRQLTPMPRLDGQGERRAINDARNLDIWLHTNALEEVKGNEYQEGFVRGMNPKKLSTSDSHILNDILFGKESVAIVNHGRKSEKHANAQKPAEVSKANGDQNSDIQSPLAPRAERDEQESNTPTQPSVSPQIIPESNVGKRVMFIEEVQSKRHQDAREKGYGNLGSLPDGYIYREGNIGNSLYHQVVSPSGAQLAASYESKEAAINLALAKLNKERVPPAPFEKTWETLAMRRAIRYAAENGFDRIAWTTGDQQAERYDLSKQVSEVKWNPADNKLRAFDKNNKEVVNSVVTKGELPSAIGKDAADKLLSQESEGELTLSGEDLKVGGEGMKGFYDRKLVNIANDIAKKFDKENRVKQIEAKKSATPDAEKYSVQHALDITPAMRASVLEEGQPLFRRGTPAKPTSIIPIGELSPIASVVQSERDLPVPVRARIERDNAHGQIRGVFYEGKVFIVADNLPANKEDALRTVTHEVVGHAGLRSLLGDSLNPVLDEVARDFSTDAEMERIAKTYNLDLSTPEGRREAAEEFIAHRAEDRAFATDPVMRRTFDRIRQLLRALSRRLGLGDGGWTPADVDELIRRAAREVELPGFEGTRGDARFQRAFHGSPHRFDKFTMEKIGSGEGNQTEGHGLYFAQNQEIADKFYRERLSKKNTKDAVLVGGVRWIDAEVIRTPAQRFVKAELTDDRRAFRYQDLSWAANVVLGDSDISHAPKLKGEAELVLRQAFPRVSSLQLAATNFKQAGRDDLRQEQLAQALVVATPDQLRSDKNITQERLNELNAWEKAGISLNKGALYQVNLKAAEDEYLLWDKPFSKQSEKVQSALRKAMPRANIDSNYAKSKGSDIYHSIAAQFISSSPKNRSEGLLAAGIRGIKYLDGSSRSKGEGSYNYVIFDDADVEIEDIRFSRVADDFFTRNSLKQARTPDEARDTDFVDLARFATVERNGDLLTVNEEGQEILRRAFEQNKIDEGDVVGPAESSFDGVFTARADIRRTVKSLNDAAARMSEFGYDGGDQKPVRDLAFALMEAGKAGDGTAVVRVEGASTAAIPHESLHQGSYAGAQGAPLEDRHSPESIQSLARSPVARKWRKFYAGNVEYTDASDALVVEEAAATIAGGDYAKMGITDAEAAKFLHRWFTSYTEKNGEQSLEKFRRQREAVNRTIAAVRTQQRGRIDGSLQGVRGQQASAAARTGEGDGAPPTGEEAGEREIEQGDIAARSLPGTLRSQGLVAADELYERYSNKAALADARKMLEELGFDGAESLLLNGNQQLGAQHMALSKIVQRALLDTAASVAAKDSQQSAELRARQQELATSLAARATMSGQFIQASQLLEFSVEDVMATAARVAKERGRRMTVAEAQNVQEAGEALERAAAVLDAASVKAGDARRQSSDDREMIARAEEGALTQNEIDKLRKRLAALRAKEKNRENRIAELDGELPQRASRRTPRSAQQGASPRQRALEMLLANEVALAADVATILGGGALKMARPATAPSQPALPSDMVDKIAQLGAIKLLRAERGTLSVEDFKRDMVRDFGARLEPEVDLIHAESVRVAKEMVDLATHERRIEAVAEREGNEELTRDELERIVEEEKQTQKRAGVVAGAHRQVARQFKKAQLSTVEGVMLGSPVLANAIGRHSTTEREALSAAVLAQPNMTPGHFADEMKRVHGVESSEVKAAFADGGRVLEAARRDIYASKQMAAALKRQAAANDVERDRAIAEMMRARKLRADAQRMVALELEKMRRGRARTVTSQTWSAVKGVPISLMASGDLSHLCRQGGVALAMQPQLAPEFAKATLQNIRKAGFARNVDAIEQDSDFALMQRMKVDFAFAGASKDTGEEFFEGSEVLRRIPIVRQTVGKFVEKSDEVFGGGLDHLRAALAKMWIEELRGAGVNYKDNSTAYTDVGRFINIITGRADIGDHNARITQAYLAVGRMIGFAPRYRVSRIQFLTLPLNPSFWNADPAARRIVYKNVARWYGTTGATLGILGALGWVTGAALISAFDPDDDDWLKLKVGKLRVDLTAGNQAQLRPIARLAVEGYRALSGQVTRDMAADRTGEIAARWLRSGSDPRTSLLIDLATGETFDRKPFTWFGDYGIDGAIGSRMTPINAQNFFKTGRQEGWAYAGMQSQLDFIGVGSSVYPDRVDEPKTTAEKLAARFSYRDFKSSKPLTEEMKRKINELKDRARGGTDVSAELLPLVASDVLTQKRADTIANAKNQTFLQEKFRLLSFEDAQHVLKYATPEEKTSLATIMRDKGAKKVAKDAKDAERIADSERYELTKERSSRRAEKTKRKRELRYGEVYAP